MGVKGLRGINKCILKQSMALKAHADWLLNSECPLLLTSEYLLFLTVKQLVQDLCLKRL